MQPTKLKMVFHLVAIIAFAPVLGAQADLPLQPIARIDGQEIYDEDLLPLIGGQLLQLRNQEYDLKTRALEKVVNQRLLENEARSAGLSTDALLEQVADRKLPPPGVGELEVYYLAQKDRFNRSFNEVKPQVEQALVQARRQQARQDYIVALRQKGGVAILLRRPRAEVKADPTRVRGDQDAPVTIVEFSDFQCPYCQSIESTLKAVLDKYKGKVRLGFRDFPLKQIHPMAQQAAEASRCAGDQGRFWEYHDLLYSNQTRLDSRGLTEHARVAGLDVPRFTACLSSGKFRAPVEGDIQAGATYGVSGTPAFFVNGVFLSGAQPASAFEKIIQSELEDAKLAKR